MGGFRLSTTARENFFWGGSSGLGSRLEKPQAINADHPLFSYFSRVRSQFDDAERLRGRDRQKAYTRLERTLIPEQFFYRRETPGGTWTHDYSRDIGLEDAIWEGVLSIDALERLIPENLVHFPTISEDEINDKSKGDALSKGIALLQLTWFVVQIIARAAQGLAVTELELTTAALAGLNSFMYIFWWSKPRDVRFPVVIRTKGAEELVAKTSEIVMRNVDESHAGPENPSAVRGVINERFAISRLLTRFKVSSTSLNHRIKSYYLCFDDPATYCHSR